jgi:hypothetical protein
MPGIGRPAVEANCVAVAVRFEIAFVVVVTSFAQALRFTKPKFAVVVSMRLDVIDNFSGDSFASLSAHAAKRFTLQLRTADFLPMRGFIPALDFRNRHGGLAAVTLAATTCSPSTVSLAM